MTSTSTLTEDDSNIGGTNHEEREEGHRRVSFGDIPDEIHPVIPQRSELGEDEISELWYTPIDLEATNCVWLLPFLRFSNKNLNEKSFFLVL